MSKWKKLFSGPDSEIVLGLCIALAIILAFSVVYFSKNVDVEDIMVSAVSDVSAAYSAAQTEPPAENPTESSTPPPTEHSTVPAVASTDATTAASSEEPSQSAPVSSEPASQETDTPAPSAEKTKAEIIDIFNESANKIKPNAKKVTRNYEDMQHNKEYTEMPPALQSIGSGLISQFLKKDDTPVVYAPGTDDDIITNYPVSGESWTSRITEADIAEATLEDDGTTYTVTLKFNECTDPTGSGCANAFNVLKQEDITAATSIVKSASTRYYDAVITCKIDKATGNMTWANYKLPMVLSVSAQVITTVNATVGMTFEQDYTIEY